MSYLFVGLCSLVDVLGGMPWNPFNDPPSLRDYALSPSHHLVLFCNLTSFLCVPFSPRVSTPPGGASTYLGTTVSPDPVFAKAATKSLQAMLSAGRRLSVATWNIAAINNNPFEYWITYKENPAYEELMVKVEQFLEEPGTKDVKVDQVFSEDMFTKLDSRLTGVGWTSVKSYWENDFRNRLIVSGFMKVRCRMCQFCMLVFFAERGVLEHRPRLILGESHVQIHIFANVLLVISSRIHSLVASDSHRCLIESPIQLTWKMEVWCFDQL